MKTSKSNRLGLAAGLTAVCLVLALVACSNPASDSSFVAVTDITGVPTTATVGTSLTLNGTVMPNNATNKTIIWSVKSDGATGLTISGNTLNTTAAGTVTVTATIANGLAAGIHYTKDFTITVTADSGPVTAESFTITFNQIIDAAPPLTGPTIYRTGGAERQTTATLTVQNPSQYTSINWYITGTSITGSGASFVLNSTNTDYNDTGEHYLTVEVEKDGVPYNRTITFTVAE